jgi:transposase InsO family protein
LLRDRDDKFGPAFDRAAQGVGAKVIRTAVRASNMNAVSERFVVGVRRELLDHILVLDERHLGSLLHQYQLYFNESRPHQGIGQRVPTKPILDIYLSKPIEVTSVLGGLHVDYRRAA